MTAYVPGYNDKAEEELIGRARELRPLLLKSAPEADRNRRLSPEVFKALSDAGFWKMAAPRRWGGYGTSARAMTRVGLELGRGDGSVGWVYTVLHGTTWVASLGPDALQEAVFGSGGPEAVICGVFNPPGTLDEVEGGYIVNGKWPYASGCRHASWAQLGVEIRKKDGSRHPGGFAYLRASQFTVEDSWYMMGMKGTGSETVVAKDVFIPKGQFFNIAELGGIGKHSPGKKHVGEPSDYWQFMPFLRATAHGAVAGAALSILEFAKETCARPILYTTYTKKGDSANAQAQFGSAAAKIDGAIALALKNCQLIDEAGASRVPMTPTQRAQSKGEAALGVELICQAVDQLMHLAGSSAFDERKPIERFYRDLVFAARHTANLPYVGYEIYGKSLLGVSPNIAPDDLI